MPQPLSSKESSLFRQLVKNYEAKQYKKGLKAAEQILRKNPNHGDTQAMKALIQNSLGQSEEAFALAKTALKNDMKSHVCWHVYGLLYRSVKNFEEAIKAYKFALKLEPESVQIQRDLALLQIQMRDYQGYVQSRRVMLQARPQLRHNWTAMAVAHHLAGDLAAAENVLSTYENTLKNPPPKTDTEHSEAALYKNSIIAEMGETERALEHLETIFKNSLDRTAVMELRAQFLLGLGRHEEAEKAYRALLDRNCEYRAYYHGLEKSLKLDRREKEALAGLADLYKTYAETGERVDAARRIPLDFLEGDEFREAADQYLRRMLKKGVPSTFANLKALYADESKRQIIESLVEGYVAETGTNGETEKQADGSKPNRLRESALYYVAQHYNYRIGRRLDKAMQYIDEALGVAPKSVDFNMAKARIWKHNGNTQKAADMMDHARGLDEKDRYINSKCAKYQLRNDENEKSLKTMSKFTRNETVGGPLGDLIDMQCMWYITEDGESYLRQRKLGLALKRFKTLYDIFDIWQEDQFDFHSFSLRKGQIRAYIDMVRWEDHLREHPFYARAAISAVKIYVLLYDKPHLAHGSLTNGTAGDHESMDANERKKALKRAKKEQERQEKAELERKEADKKTAVNKKGTGGDGELKKEDPDPKGEKLVQTKEPLDDAQKFLTPLLLFSPKNLQAQHAGFEVYIRKKRYLLALRCLLAASSIDPDSASLHEQTVRFVHAISQLPSPLPEKANAVLSATSSNLPSPSSLAEHNTNFLATHTQSPQHVHSGLRARYFLDPESRERNEKDLMSTLELPDSNISLEDAREGLELLADWRSVEGVRKDYLEKCRTRWPEATVFR